jgi:hypothetical protein
MLVTLMSKVCSKAIKKKKKKITASDIYVRTTNPTIYDLGSHQLMTSTQRGRVSQWTDVHGWVRPHVDSQMRYSAQVFYVVYLAGRP